VLTDFFLHLKARRLPVSTREFLTLLEALQSHVCGHSIDEFYFLARACLVKDESNYDKFDRAFGEYFKGVEAIPGLAAEIPEDWLALMVKRHLTPEEKTKLEKLGWDRLMEEFRKRRRRQLALRSRRLPPGRHTRRRRIGGKPQRGQGVAGAQLP
jgi:uncharacterized protein with von Willebrand factor type A (vWA) domain